MLVTGNEMACVEVTSHTLQAQFLLVFLIIKMCSHTIVCNLLWEEIRMAFLARTVEDDARSIFLCSLAFKVEVFFVVSQVHPNVVQAHFGLFPVVRGCA